MNQNLIELAGKDIVITSDWANHKVGSNMITIIRYNGDSKKVKQQIIENQILRKLFEESISINKAIVERLKNENKVYWIMEASVVQDEKLLKHIVKEAAKQEVPNQ